MTGNVPLTWPDVPYKGLGYYTESDALLFAGRDEDTRVCAAMLAESRIRVLLLHGLTGCGKSSFLRAGLFPFLERRRAGLAFATAPASASQILLIRSTPEPLAALAHELFRFSSNRVQVDTPDGVKTIDFSAALPPGHATDEAEFLREFGSDPDAVLNVLDGLSRLLSDTLILIIDQAEDVLTVGGTAKERESRDRFFAFLAEFCRRQFDLKLVVSLRTEYLGRFLAKARPQIRGAGMAEFFLDDLQEGQIREAILRPTSAKPVGENGPPSEKYQFSFAEEVVEQMIAQVGQASGGKLTALQMVCTALYERVSTTGDRRITIQTLRDVGGVEGSIERFVDDTLFECGRDANLAPVVCEQEATRWKGVLHGLARAQPDGTVTTDIREVDVLRRELAGSRLPFDSTAAQLVRNLLLRPVNVVDVKSGTIVPCFGLGHDALGLVLRSWKARHDRHSSPVQSGGDDDFEDEHHHTQDDMALCLSGDGYQAMLFNLGAVRCLNDLGVLPRLACVSGVSGGAIVAALLGYRWRELTRDDGFVQDFDSKIAAPLCRLADQTIARPWTIPSLFGLGKAGNRRLVDALDRLYEGATLRDLSDELVVVVTATNLTCGSLFHFSKWHLTDSQLGRVTAPQLTLATAVAASSAVLPTSPVVLTFENEDWEQRPAMGPPKRRYREKVHLADGGIYDNLGLEGAWKRHRTILISDGSAVPAPAGAPSANLIAQIVRLVSVMDQSLRTVRERQVAEAFEAGHKRGLYWTRRDPIDINLASSVNVGHTSQELAGRGVFEKLSAETQKDLINWGYAACDAAFRGNSRARGYRDLPAKLPYSRTGDSGMPRGSE